MPLGQAALLRPGDDIALVSLGVGVHRCLEAAALLARQGVSAQVLDLRSVAPIDAGRICDAVRHTGRLLVVDEDYLRYGLSGEIAAIVAEAGIPMRFARVATETTIPFAREQEAAALPNVARILAAARRLMAS